jgi:hypothetical protein
MSEIIESSIIESPIVQINNSCVPTKVIERNKFGLINDPDIKYHYDENGFINWRKMIPVEYLVPNRQIFSKNGKKVPQSVNGLDDKEVLILLAGIKYLGNLRGYTDVQYKVVSPSVDQVIAICSIKFIPNYETEGKEATFSSLADANTSNTNSFGKYYLSAIAENRSYVRTIRNFLRISIVGADEVNIPIPDGQSNSDTKMVTTALLEVMNTNNIPFEIIKKKLIEEKFVDENGKTAESYTCVNDIDTAKQFELISRIKSKAKKNE